MNDPVWHFKYGGKSEHLKITHPGFTANTYLVLQKAALSGLGIALLPLRPIYREVLEGRLTVLLPDHPVPDRPLFAVYPPGRQPLKKVKVFLDFIHEWFREHPMLEPPQAAPRKSTPVASSRST